MRAKFINEIKRGEESGLGSIGIGRSILFRSYDYFMKKNPESVSSETIEKYIENHKHIINFDLLDDFLPAPYSDYVILEGYSDNEMGDYLESLKGEIKTSFISLEGDGFMNFYINAFYNITYNIGFFNFVSPVVGDENSYTYFVKQPQ